MSIVRGPREPLHEFRTRRREEAVRLFECFECGADLSVSEIARRIGVSRKYVSQWHTAWEQGDRSFIQAPAIGPKPRLTEEQKQLIRQHIMAGPKAAGYAQQVWTQKRIAELIVKLTGIQYHPYGIRVLMSSMDISYQKPALRTRQKSEKKKAEFLEQTWVAVKKGSQESSK